MLIIKTSFDNISETNQTQVKNKKSLFSGFAPNPIDIDQDDNLKIAEKNRESE